MDETVLREVLANPDYQLLTRVPTAYTAKTGEHSKRFIATIIDLETMGLDLIGLGNKAYNSHTSSLLEKATILR